MKLSEGYIAILDDDTGAPETFARVYAKDKEEAIRVAQSMATETQNRLVAVYGPQII